MPVAILAFGYEKSPWLPQYLVDHNVIGSAEEDVWNLRNMMADPLKGDRVSHNENGSSDRTQIAVFGQEAFTPTVEAVLGWFFEYHCLDCEPSAFVPLGCRTGNHRAHTMGLGIEAGLNTMLDGDGNKCFEAQLFHVSAGNNRKEAEHICSKAIEWANEAWTEMPHEDIDALYGYKSCRQSRESAENHVQFRKFLLDCNDWLITECDRFMAEDKRSKPVPSAAPNPVSDDSQPMSSQSSKPSPTLGDVYSQQRDKREKAIDSRLNKPKLTI